MVDKKACKIRKRKYKVNGAIFVTRFSFFLLVVVSAITIYNKMGKNNLGKVLETSAYMDESGISSMVKGVENGAVYTSSVNPIVTNVVEEATLTKDGKEIKFKSGRKISKIGSYILTLEDKYGNIDTIYFDIEN